MFSKVYLHSSKDEMYATGEELGLTGKALEEFMYTCYEVEIGLEVDEKTGKSKIVSVDGQKLMPKGWAPCTAS